MSYALPKELKTQKVNSLPDGLKSIAEQLIAEKFDVREEVLEKPRAKFRPVAQTAQPAYDRCHDPFCESCYGGDMPPRHAKYDRHHSRSGVADSFGMRTTVISVRSLYELKREFDVRDINPRRREWRMGQREFREITKDVDSYGVIQLNLESVSPEIFGIPVQLHDMTLGYVELRETFY